MSTYDDTLRETEGLSRGKLLERIKTLECKLETATARANACQREAEEYKDSARSLEGAYKIACDGRTEAQHRARALEYALQPFAGLQSLAGSLLPVERQHVDEACALLGGGGIFPRLVVREYAVEMEAALRRNENKPDWAAQTTRDVFEHLKSEFAEAVIEIDELLDGENGRHRRVREETIDLGVCAMLQWDKSRARGTINRGREVAR